MTNKNHSPTQAKSNKVLKLPSPLSSAGSSTLSSTQQDSHWNSPPSSFGPLQPTVQLQQPPPTTTKQKSSIPQTNNQISKDMKSKTNAKKAANSEDVSLKHFPRMKSVTVIRNQDQESFHGDVMPLDQKSALKDRSEVYSISHASVTLSDKSRLESLSRDEHGSKAEHRFGCCTFRCAATSVFIIVILIITVGLVVYFFAWEGIILATDSNQQLVTFTSSKYLFFKSSGIFIEGLNDTIESVANYTTSPTRHRKSKKLTKTATITLDANLNLTMVTNIIDFNETWINFTLDSISTHK